MVGAVRRRAPLRRDERINVGLPTEMHAALYAQAETQNVPVSVVVRWAIAFYQEHAPAAAPFRLQTEAAS